jgi:hypothetical protein
MALHIFSLISGKHPAPTMVSSDATKGQVSDVYGQLHPKETPELIAQKLIEMEMEIEKLQLAADTNGKQNCLQLQQAQERCPELLTDGFKLMFLRCEVFNANVSYFCCILLVPAGINL